MLVVWAVVVWRWGIVGVQGVWGFVIFIWVFFCQVIMCSGGEQRCWGRGRIKFREERENKKEGQIWNKLKIRG